MKLEISGYRGNLSDDMRGAGYHYDGQDPKTKQLRFYKSFSASLFPRFHIYASVEKSSNRLILNLHLDQKAPVYEGSTAHGGDYEGPVIEKEEARLKTAFSGKNLPKLELDW